MSIKKLLKKLLPSFVLSWYHFLLAFLGAFFYGFPSSRRSGLLKGRKRKLIVIGVTGTSGKSTVVELIARVLEEAGHKTASISSIDFRIGKRKRLNRLKMTMPGRFKIQRFLRQAAKTGCHYAVIEVTSEGILQYRHKFIDFDVVVFTNLSPEHLERHGGFEKYRQAKGKLFQVGAPIHIINLDDRNAGYFLQFPARKKFGFGVKSQRRIKNQSLAKDIRIVEAEDVETRRDHISFRIPDSRFQIPLLGRFNVYNALAAISVALSQGIDLKTCESALEKVDMIPGRMEMVAKEPFRVIVDYAHTPDSLQKVYQTIRNFKFPTLPVGRQITNSKLICVLGSCGGGRDKWKRPELGRIAAQYCNQIILTNEDPYDENPMEIIGQIASGIGNISVNQRSNQRKSALFKILDRRGAINKALQLAKPGDVVIITGKGCEPWMCVAGGKKISWDDREIVREQMGELRN